MPAETQVIELDRHEMTTLCETDRSSRFSSILSTRTTAESVSFSSGWRANVIVAALLFVSLAFIVLGGWFTAKFLYIPNFNGAIWSFLTGAISCGVMTLFLLQLTRKLEEWHDQKTLQGLKLFSMVMCVVSCVAVGVYIVLGFVRKQNFTTSEDNYFAAALFSGFCLGCNVLLYFTSQWFQNILQDTEPRPIPLPERIRRRNEEQKRI